MKRGGLLIEMIIAIALFVGAALVVTGAMRSGLENTLRAMERELAADIAASAFARVEAGIATASDIDGPVAPYEDPDDTTNFQDLLPEPTGWAIEASTERSTFGDLTMLTVTAMRTGPAGEPRPGPARAAVEGLVHVARVVEDAELEQSELSRELDRLGGGP